MKRKVFAALLATAMVGTMLAGCGTPGSGGSDGGGSGSDEKVFRYSTSTEPTTLDPTKGNCIPDNEIAHALTESLVRNTGGEIEAGVAESLGSFRRRPDLHIPSESGRKMERRRAD